VALIRDVSAVLSLEERIKNAPLALIAARIRRARKEADLSHDRLAEGAGTSRQHLIKLEKGKHRPRAQMLTRIAEHTGREIDWFVDPDLDPSPFPDVEAA
jgi:transcriptional regulator with XRE-family HTH domain